MSFSPNGKDRNFMASLRRTVDYGWFGDNAAFQFGQAPTLMPGEFVTQINPTNTGVVNLLGADANGQSVTPMQVSIPITSAQILTLFSAPVSLVAAPGAGFALVVDQLVIEMNRTSTAYTGGGAVGPVYHGSTTAVTAVMAAADVTTGGAGQIIRALGNNIAGGPAVLVNTGIDLAAATANFAAGTGTMKVFISYSIVTV